MRPFLRLYRPEMCPHNGLATALEIAFNPAGLSSSLTRLGLLESACQACMQFELTERRLSFEAGKPLPLIYKDVRLDCGYRIDLCVEGVVTRHSC